MLLDRWMESSFTTFPDHAHRDHVDHVMLKLCSMAAMRDSDPK